MRKEERIAKLQTRRLWIFGDYRPLALDAKLPLFSEGKRMTPVVHHIFLRRADGLAAECEPQIFVNLKDANNALRLAARSAPADGSYDKVDLAIVWTNGDTYFGRFDLESAHRRQVYLIENHVRSYLEWVVSSGHRLLERVDVEDAKRLLTLIKTTMPSNRRRP